MQNERFFVHAGEAEFPASLLSLPSDVVRPILWLDADRVPESTMNIGLFWFMKAFQHDGLIAHDEDEMLFFLGNDKNDPENLHAHIELTLENDVLSLEHTCAVYIPKGTAHGDLKVTDVEMPVMVYACQFDSPYYTSHPATASKPEGTFANYAVEKYAPTSGKIPEGPKDFLQLLVWLAGDKVPGAPYLELCRFMSTNDTGPEAHKHGEEEFIGFIGTDPEHPEDLGAEVHFWLGDEDIATTESTVIFVPGDLKHSPIVVPELHRDIIHFSGSHATEYVRTE